MKKSLLFLFSLASPYFLYSQANSVTLKDGAGNPIGSHASIGSAYAAIPATLSQAYIIELAQTYNGSGETFPITFVAKTGAGPSNTITVRPAADVSSITLTGSNSTTLLRLDDADYIIIDGRPGGLGNAKALTIGNTNTSSSSSGIQLINGACNNLIRYCNITGYASASSGNRGIYIQASASNPSGNSNNRFEFLTFNGPRYYINSSGTGANPNRNLYLYGCEFVDIRFCGWWQQAGTGKVTLDSNLFYCNVPTGTSGTGTFAILSDFQTDTILVHRNKIYNMDNGTYNTDVVGMIFRSFNAGSYLEITNNFISLMAPNMSSDLVRGIEFGTNSAANPVQGKIYFNTVRIGGTSSVTSTPGNLNSAPLCFDATNALSNFDIRNNIFINERTGGVEQHVAVALLTNNGTIARDHNTYFSASPNFAQIGGTLFPDFNAYQAAASPNESASNANGVFFVSDTDLHLTGTSVGDANLYGIAIPGITTDIDGDVRDLVTPYRGADEAAPIVIGCSGVPNPGTAVANPASVCAGDSVTVNLTGLNPGAIPELSFQWQSSPDSVNYTNVGGATNISLSTAVTQQTYFRAIVTCTTSSLSDTSAAGMVSITPDVSVTSISENHNVGQYDFTAVGVQNATTYAWNFGDGNTSSAVAPTHNYTAAGTYDVKLVVSNACSSDSASLQVTVGCEGTPNGGTIIGNPSAVCPEQSFTLTHTGINPLIAPTISLQWQSSPDGTNFTDISGQTSATLSTNITANTTFRVLVTCTASGLFAYSNQVNVNFTPLPTVASISETHTAGSYQFTANGLQNATSTLWNFGDGTSAVAVNPSHTYTTGGNYAVMVVAINACGTDTATLSINVGCDGAPSTATVNASQDSACVGDAVLFSLAGLDAAQAVFYTYQWQRSTDGTNFNNITGATSATLNIAVGIESFFRCIVTCPNSGQSTPSQTKQIAIGSPITGGSIVEQHNNYTYNFALTGISGAFSASWDFGDGNTSNQLAPQHTYASNGTYTVSVTVSNACDSETFTLSVGLTVNIDEPTPNEPVFVLYPNPTEDLITITSPNTENTSVESIRVSDITGKTYYIGQTGITLPFTLSSQNLGFVPGIYLLELQTNAHKRVYRFIVQ